MTNEWIFTVHQPAAAAPPSSRRGLLQDQDLVLILIPGSPGSGHWPLQILTGLHLQLMEGWGWMILMTFSLLAPAQVPLVRAAAEWCRDDATSSCTSLF